MFGMFFDFPHARENPCLLFFYSMFAGIITLTTTTASISISEGDEDSISDDSSHATLVSLCWKTLSVMTVVMPHWLVFAKNITSKFILEMKKNKTVKGKR